MIGIIGAMEVEIKDLISSLDDFKIEKFHNYTFYLGKYKNKELVVLEGGISKVNAAIAATTLILRYNVDAVITTGIAGGTNDLEPKDIVVLNEYIFGDVDATFFGYGLGQIPREKESFIDDSNKIEDIYNHLKNNYKGVYLGACLTQDKFITSMSDVKITRPILCCEMESTAIKFTCEKFNIPCYGIRYISDIIGKESQIDDYAEFEENTAHLSAHICLEVVELL